MIVNVDIAQNVNFNGFRRLSDCRFAFRVKNNGVVEDITGWTYTMIIYSSGRRITMMTINSGNYLSIASNTVTVLIPSAEFIIVKGEHEYEIKRTNGSQTEYVMIGNFIVI